MKLIIQIPCLNEAETIGITLAELPREVEGFDEVEWLIIDDGSTDDTVEVALNHGIDHVVSHITNKGLAQAFMTGTEACLERGADVIVNTDADNQYSASDIPALTNPIIEKKCDMVIGYRPIRTINHFSPVKKALQRLGSWVVRSISQTNVQDAPSGFRAISKEAALRLMVFNEYTYTLETIIQAGQKNLKIENVPVGVNDDLRPSRLFSSMSSYIQKSVMTMLRIFIIYRPARVFGIATIVLFGIGLLLGLRFLYYWLSGDGDGHVQSLILSAILLIMGFQSLIATFLADLIAANRKMLEDLRYNQKKNKIN
jgi:glycosyltransferase involved in cell wall biosynthesis